MRGVLRSGSDGDWAGHQRSIGNQHEASLEACTFALSLTSRLRQNCDPQRARPLGPRHWALQRHPGAVTARMSIVQEDWTAPRPLVHAMAISYLDSQNYGKDSPMLPRRLYGGIVCARPYIGHEACKRHAAATNLTAQVCSPTSSSQIRTLRDSPRWLPRETTLFPLCDGAS